MHGEAFKAGTTLAMEDWEEDPMSNPESRLRRWKRALVEDVRNHPLGYGVLATFTLGGPLIARILFPEAPLGVLVPGGFMLGAYAALSAVPDLFL
jgi:hypothetical protein